MANRPLVLRYALGLGLAVGIGVVRGWLNPLLGPDAPLLPFVLAVFGAAYLSGLGPALLAIVASVAIAQVQFVQWQGRPGEVAAWIAHIILFVMIASIIALIMHLLQRAERSLRLSVSDARIAEQAAMRSEERLRAVAAALQLADQRKDEFLAMLAHELRNPLAPMRNIGQILAHECATQQINPATVSHAAALLKRQIGHLAHLIDDLLDVARITHGTIELDRERVDLESIVEQALETVRPLLMRKRQLIDARKLEVEPLQVLGDPTRLCQIVGNLLTNAAKYSPEGASIEVRLERQGDKVQLSVRDPGIGIDPAILPRIFDLFVQGDRSLDRAEGGLGIGLTIVKYLIELHDGTVEAHSEGLGRGSEFVVSLPAAEPIARQPPEEIESMRARV